MSRDKELKESIERNKDIRKEQNDQLKAILKNSNTDEDMRETRDLEEKKITATSKSDRKERRLKFWVVLSTLLAVAAIVVAIIYFT